MENSRAAPQKLKQSEHRAQQHGSWRSTPKGRERSPEDTLARLRPSQRDSQQPSREQPKCPSADEWISDMCSVRTVECHSAFKRKDVPPHPRT